MSYYDTIDDDVKRAKEILATGRPDPPSGPYYDHEGKSLGGTIYGVDIYAAYKLLESFVEEIERLRQALVKVRAHTSYPDIPNLVLLDGLLKSIERITDAALSGHPDP